MLRNNNILNELYSKFATFADTEKNHVSLPPPPKKNKFRAYLKNPTILIAF